MRLRSISALLGEPTDAFRRHAKWSLIRHGVNAAVLAFAFPFYLRQLGGTTYSIWAIALSISSYVQFADFGFGVALTHHIGRAHASGDHAAVYRRLLAGMSLVVAMGFLLFALVATIVVPPLVALARVGEPNAGIAIWATRVTLAAAFLRVLASLPQGALAGMGELSTGAQIEIATTLVGTTIMVVLAGLGFGLRGFVYAGLVGPFLLLVTTLRQVLARIKGKELPSFKTLRRESLTLVRSGTEVQLTALVALALHPASRIFVSRFGGLSEVAALDFSERAILAFRGVLVAVLAPAIPAAARARDLLVETVTGRLHRVNRFIATWGAGVAVAVFTGGPWLLRLWLGSTSDINFGFATFTLRVYVAVYLLNSFTIFPFYSMQGAGYTRGPLICQVVAGMIALGGGWALGSAFGSRGVVSALALGVLVASALVLVIYRRWIEGMMRRSISQQSS